MLALAVAFITPRLTDVRSLVYRGYLWRDTLAAWSEDPAFGIGPGSMPLARQAAAPPLSLPVRQPHSHDIPLGILGDAGLVGLAAALALFVTFVVVAGPWRTRSLAGRAAFAVLMGFAAGMLFEDLTFLPAFNLIVILLAAMALLEAGAVRWQPIARAARLPAAVVAGVAAVALVAVMAVGDAERHRLSQRNRCRRARAAGRRRVPRSTTPPPSNPLNPAGPKALAVAADRLGRIGEARAAAQEAVRLSPGDGPSWINLALLCREQGDRACARHAADRAVDAATPQGRELVNAAVVYEWLGDTPAADRAYRLSMLTNYLTGLTRPWPRPITIGDERAERAGGRHRGTEPADRPTADRRADPGRRLRRRHGAGGGGGHDRRPGRRRGGGAARLAPRPVVHRHVGGGRPAGTPLRHRRWTPGACRRCNAAGSRCRIHPSRRR